MSNPSKSKGTAFETKLLEKLQVIWPRLTRAAASSWSNDYTGPFPIEAKKRKTWAIPEWVRKLRRRATHDRTGNQWCLFVSPGDLRKEADLGDIMIVDADFGIDLLDAWVLVHPKQWAGK